MVPLDEMKFEERTVITALMAKIPTVFTDPQGTGLYSDPADPINVPTGFISVAVVEADTPDVVLVMLLKDATVIAEDQQIGNYRWKIVESRAVLKGVLTCIAVAKLPDGKHFLKVIVGGPQDNADAILATLWEPVLGSIKAQ